MEVNHESLNRQRASFKQIEKAEISRGAFVDPDNGAIAYRGKRSEKPDAVKKAKNINDDIDRPQLAEMSFDELKANLLRSPTNDDIIEKPDPKFLDTTVTSAD